MRYIDGLDNHENLEELLEKAETRIKENSLDEALTHMRKAVEYMVQQFVRENPDCSGNDLSEMMHNLEGAGILKKGDANILHQIRRKGNTVGAHVTGEEITRQQAEELFDDLLQYVPKFLDVIPYPSSRNLKSKGRLSIDFDKIPPLEIRVSLEQLRRIRSAMPYLYYYYEKPNFARLYEDGEWKEDSYYFLPFPEEYIYQTRDGRTFINRSEYARYYDRKVRRITNAKKQLEWDNAVLIPGMLQEFFGFSIVYQDGITPVFVEPNGNDMISDQALYTHEIRLPNYITRVTNPTLEWCADLRPGAEWINMDCSTIEEQDDDDEARNYGWIKSDLRGIYLSNQLSEDCNFKWTKVVPADKVFLNPGENSTISLRKGSVYSADGKTLIYARVEGDSFDIPEGVEVIRKGAFRETGVKQIGFPKSLRRLDEGALWGYQGDKLILPDSVTDIDEEAYVESLPVFYESQPDVNINPQYEKYLEERRKAAERDRILEEERREQYKIRQAQLEKEEQERKKKEEIARKEAEEKAKKERKKQAQKEMRKRLGILAALLLMAAGAFYVGGKIREQAKIKQAEEAYKKAEAVTYGTSEDGLYEYKIYHDTLTVTQYLGSETELVIPGEIDGYPVRILGTEMFKDAFIREVKVRSVVIPDSVEELENGLWAGGVFQYLDALEEVYIPGSVKVIGDYAFYSCEHLTKVEMEEGVERLGEMAFGSCYQLAEITIPKSVKEIGSSCFLYTKIKELTVSPDCQVAEDVFSFDMEDSFVSYYE